MAYIGTQVALDMAGEHARGGTAYVTLEPCGKRHIDETSCSVRLLDAGIARVVCAVADTHPTGAGGLHRLRAAGVEISVGIKGSVAQHLYADFFATAKSNSNT